MDSTDYEWKHLPQDNEVPIFNTEKEKKWSSPWYFIQGADPQYGLIERYINKSTIPNWDKEIELTEKLVQKINCMEPKPKFFIICGDLCDAVPTSEPQLFKEQEQTFKRIFSKLDPNIPLLVVCGNHDVGDNPTHKAIEIYRTSWGDDYYSFWCGGAFFLIINTQYYVDSDSASGYANKHSQWLENQLKIAKSSGVHCVVMFQHIPWFMEKAEHDPDNYFTIKKEFRTAMLDKLIDSGVQKVFCGHYHRNAGGYYKNLEVIVTSAIGGQLGKDVSGVRIVKMYENNIEHEYIDIDDLPSVVQL